MIRRRIFTGIFTALAIISLMAAGRVAWTWGADLFHYFDYLDYMVDYTTVAGNRAHIGIRAKDSWIGVLNEIDLPRPAPGQASWDLANDRSHPWIREHHFAGFAWGSGETGYGGASQRGWAMRNYRYVTGLGVPLWAAQAITLILPAIWLRRRQREMTRKRRRQRGLCVTCGYDLRASRAICPECGEAVADALDVPSTAISGAAQPAPRAAALPAAD